MNAATRTGRQTIKDRRAGLARYCISTHVARATKDEAARKTVTDALRKTAKQMRESGALGRVQVRIGKVAEGVMGPTYRYTAVQVAALAAVYKPRKDTCKAVRLALLAR